MTVIGEFAPDAAAGARAAVATRLRELYPGSDPPWVAPLRPDLLAEQLLATCVQLSDLILAGYASAGKPEQLEQLLAELTHADTRPAVREALGQLLDAHLPVLFTAAVDRPPSRLPDLLDLALTHCPQPEAAVTLVSQLPERSTGLAALAATLTSQQVTQYRAGARGGEPDAADRLASSLNDLSVRLGDLGRREEALAAIQEAAEVYRDSSGVALLVYGLSSASTDQAGVSHWADPKVIASLAAAVVLLAAFVITEARSRHPLMPLRILANRSRSGSYLIMLVLATAMFGLFFFLTIFVQDVLGYSALKAGLAFLPLAGTIVVVSGIASQLISRTGARPLMLAGPAVAAGGMYWFSHISVHTTYTGGLLGPSLVTGAGLGMLFVPLSLVVLTRVRDQDSGLVSSLLNTGQQVGGAIGLAALGTVAWTTVANSARSQVATAAAAASRSGQTLQAKPGSPLPASIYHNALAVGISRGLLVASAIALAALIIAAVTIRVRREDLTGTAAPTAQQQPAGAEPAMEPASS